MTHKHWLKLPVVSAPGMNREEVFYGISDMFVERSSDVLRRSPIFQLWTHVAGELPPINNIDRVRKGPLVPDVTTLWDAVACFRGVNRPYDDEENGASVRVYVLNPRVSIDFEVDMACLAKAVRVPQGACLTVQVKPLRDSLQVGSHTISAVVTRLEFVLGDGNDPILPRGHADRYSELLWHSNGQ